jgi:hypothetical protein
MVNLRNKKYQRAMQLWLVLAVAACTSAFRSDQVVFAQAGPQSDEIVIAKIVRFADYQQDFLHFAQVGSGSTDEYEVAMDLVHLLLKLVTISPQCILFWKFTTICRVRSTESESGQ